MLDKYRDYFDIDPEYFPNVNEKVIKEKPELWKKFYPHTTFVKLIRDTVSVLNRQQKVSIWVEGAYGTGKSHAVLTLKRLLDASEEDTKAYFERYGLDNDLYNKFQGAKNAGKILTVHRYGSSNIQGDNDLVLAIQESIEKAFAEAGIENKASDALKIAVIKWLEDADNKAFFNNLAKGSYATLFGGDDADSIVAKLSSYEGDSLRELMRKISKFAKERQITAFKLSVHDLCEWIRETIKVNDLKAIVFIWDEFTEFFGNNLRNLTGFQEIAEISETDPFYLLIVTHKSAGLFSDADKDKTKILDRFIKPTCIIELPENIAFQLMGEAMQKKDDETILEDWKETVDTLYEYTKDSRKLVTKSARISDEELMKILPIHPYAALLLKHISSAFDSNQRSMFDFIKNDRGDSNIKGFQWFIDNYGPYNENPLLTVDMLWDFFYEVGKEHLSHDIRSILDCFGRAKNLSTDEKSVYKTILLLQAISQKVGDSVELFVPNEKNIRNAFEGTDLDNGKAAHIAAKLATDKVVYLKKLGNNETQYSALTVGVDTGAIEEEMVKVRQRSTSMLVSDGALIEAVTLPGAMKLRYRLEAATVNDFDTVVKRIRSQAPDYPGKISALITFAKDDEESTVIGKKIADILKDDSYDIVFIDASITPFGKDGYEQYVENAANSAYHAGKDNGQSSTYDKYAKDELKKWKNRIAQGEFLVYSREKSEPERATSTDSLVECLKEIDKQRFNDCLECEYTVIDGMYTASSLKVGVECGATETVTGTFRSSNPMTKLEEALKGAWLLGTNYWETSPHLLISRIKIYVDKLIRSNFDIDGRVSIKTIYDALKEKPYGFMPCNLSAFIMGFVLKEYAKDGAYTWSDGLTNETLTVAKLKEMVGEVISLDITPNNRYRDKFIGTMTPEEKAFNDATSKAFGIDEKLCTTVEQTRERIRAKMKEYSFPIWTLKYVIDEDTIKSDAESLISVIDCYCGIANNNNMAGGGSENDIAIKIGKLCMTTPEVVDDLQSMLTKEKCTDGMIAYLEQYEDRMLINLAEEIGDNGQFINVLRKKFDADAANWVWNVETANKKIADVTVEYQIIRESNKINSAAISFQSAMDEWCDKCSRIKISYPAAKNQFGGMAPFMEMLYKLKQMGDIVDSQRKLFLDLLKANGEEFKNFYTNQVDMFKVVCGFYLEGLSEEEIREMFGTLSLGMFVKEKSEYVNTVAQKVEEYKSTLGYNKLKKFWKEKTGTESPKAWSLMYKMPILAMVSEADYSDVKAAFDTLNRIHPDAGSVEKAKTVLEKASFFEQLAQQESRDKAFVEKVVKSYAVLLTDINEVKEYLFSHITPEPYEWLGVAAIDGKLKMLAESKYNQYGCDNALEKIENMGVEQVKKYLKDLIRDNMIVGMEIIKNN